MEHYYPPITKYNPPTRFDKEPFKTIYKHSMDDGHYELYIQSNTDAQVPKWIPIHHHLFPLLTEIYRDPKLLEAIIKIIK